MKSSILPVLLFLCALCGRATVYNVGPGQAHTSIGSVPWESLNAGDIVNIHYRPAPYKEKFVLSRVGTANAPIIVRGILGPNGEYPVLDGNGASTRSQLQYYSQERGVIKIGGSTVPAADGINVIPQYLVIENLDICNAKEGNSFTAPNGSVKAYLKNASAIYLEFGHNITIRNCRMHGCGNGFFSASTGPTPSKNVLVEACYIYDNGNSGSIYEHNNYTSAVGITFQYNRFGPLCSGCSGNNLKDRSAGTVIRYNWIEGGNRQLDLVEDGHLQHEPSYRSTYVYGNILIEPDGAGNSQIVHYGGDSGDETTYRKGTLYFYNNTVISKRSSSTTLFRLSSNSETCDARNNLFYVTASGNSLRLLDNTGTLNLSHNWFKPGYLNSAGTLSGTINNDGTQVTTSSPGFINEAGADYHIAAASPCRNGGTLLNSAVLPAHPLKNEYLKHQFYATRTSDAAIDIGAFEYDPSAGFESFFSHNLVIYPNPVADELFLVLAEPSRQIMYLKIVDLTGKKISEDIIEITDTVKKISVKEWMNGMYILAIESPGGIMGRKKIIVNH